MKKFEQKIFTLVNNLKDHLQINIDKSILYTLMSAAIEHQESNLSQSNIPSDSSTQDKKEAITITFGEVAENHIGQQQISQDGFKIESGLTLEQLEHIAKQFQDLGANQIELIHLRDYLPDDRYKEADSAYVLVVRNGFDVLLQNQQNVENGSDLMLQEHQDLEKDSKFFDTKRKKVLNKQARHNLCFDDLSQQADYENKKGTIVSFDDVPMTKMLREFLADMVQIPVNALKAEGNYYYDTSKCGIGFHGDTERKIVIAIRLGESIPLHYQWFHQSEPIGERCQLELHHGDIYFMSDKAVGYDWKKRSILTLRHAAGAKKYLTIAKRKSKKAEDSVGSGNSKQDKNSKQDNKKTETSDDKVKNPKTGRLIQIGKGVYEKLLKEGYVLVDGELVLSTTTTE